MKKFAKILSVFAVVSALVLLVSAGSTYSVALVTDVGGVNDQGFNQSAWEGLKKAGKDLGVKGAYKESKQEADYRTNLDSLVGKVDLIWGIGFLMGDAVKAQADQNAKQNYAIIDFAYDKTPKNLVGVVFKAQEASFLVGYIAGKMTKTNKVGFIGGIRGFIIDQFEYGFRAGVKQANPKVDVIVQYAESFTDSAKGKAIATSMYQQGADIVFPAAGGTGNGALEASKEQKKWSIGVDRDQNYLAPNNVITSALKRVDQAVYNLVKESAAGKFPGGTTVVYGLKEGGVGFVESKLVPEAILKETRDLRDKVIAGSIVVPFNKETFDKFSGK